MRLAFATLTASEPGTGRKEINKATVNVMATFGDGYRITEMAFSKHPGDWGRAKAMTDLAAQGADEERGSGYEDLYGEELHLLVREANDDVRIRLSWAPGGD